MGPLGGLRIEPKNCRPCFFRVWIIPAGTQYPSHWPTRCFHNGKPNRPGSPCVGEPCSQLYTNSNSISFNQVPHNLLDSNCMRVFWIMGELSCLVDSNSNVQPWVARQIEKHFHHTGITPWFLEGLAVNVFAKHLGISWSGFAICILHAMQWCFIKVKAIVLKSVEIKIVRTNLKMVFGCCFVVSALVVAIFC